MVVALAPSPGADVNYWEVLRAAALPDEHDAEDARATALPLLEWTERYRRIGDRPLRPGEWPWLRDLYRLGDETPRAWVMKSSQVGISEWLVSTALWVADSRLGGRGNVLYVFPTQVTMDDFAQARVDKAIEESDYLRGRVGTLTYQGKSAVSRVRLKRIGPGHLYFRGSDNRAQLLTIDADCLCLDEVDEFKENVLPTARQRLNSSLAANGLGIERAGSTPKYPASGIAPIYYEETTRRRYFLRCEGCGLRQPLKFPDNVTREGLLVCKSCGHQLDRLAEGEWVAEYPQRDIEGYHVWRAYSPRTNLAELAKTGYLIQDNLLSNPSAVQEFYNQQLGVPHAPAGGSLTDEVLLACVRDYGHPATAQSGPVVMGVDVGGVLHVTIWGPSEDDIEQAGSCRLLYAGTTDDWGELERLWQRFGCHYGVIDAQPEGEKARVWCQRALGRRYRCYFPNMQDWKHADLAVWNPEEWVVQAHRTNALDAMMDRFYQQKMLLPRDAPHLPGFVAQLKAPIRVLSKDSDGRTVARYDEGGADDHFCFGSCYAFLAWRHFSVRWGVKSLERAEYEYGGTQPEAQTRGKVEVLSRRKHPFFNDAGVDPFKDGREQQAQEREARRFSLELQRAMRRAEHQPKATEGEDQ